MQQRIDDGVGADAERQCQDGQQRRARLPQKHPRAVGQVRASESIHIMMCTSRMSSFAISMLPACRRAARTASSRDKALPHVLLDQHLDVKGELVVEARCRPIAVETG
jgi:hypothetical protein